MKNLLIASAAALAAVVSIPAMATTIDFANYTAGTRIDGALTVSGATIISSSGTLLIDDFGGGNAICAFDGFGCSAALSLQFDTPVNGFKTNFSGDETAGSRVLFQGETTQLAFTAQAFGDGDPATRTDIGVRFRELVNVSFVSNDPGGVAFGSFAFSAAGVPEPASWAMLIGGFGMAGGALRRRRTAALVPA